MRVIVTGAAGFLGSHLVDTLVAAGHEVTALDNLSTGNRLNLAPEVPLIRADVCAPLDDLFARVRPEVVLHLAAQVSVPNSVADPLHDSSVNIGGTVNVMTAAAKAGARKVITMSSAAVYGIPAQLPLTEESPLAAISPYGLAKLAGEQYVRLLGQQYGIAYTIVRPANIYGPRQTTAGEGAVIPAFLNRFLSGKDPVIHGDGSQTRDFVYVTDMAHALIQAMTAGDGLTVNVSSGVAVSVNELWRELAALLGWSRAPVYGPTRAGDIPHSVMAHDLAKVHLGWQPEVPLVQGLFETVAWRQLADVAAAAQE